MNLWILIKDKGTPRKIELSTTLSGPSKKIEKIKKDKKIKPGSWKDEK